MSFFRHKLFSCLIQGRVWILIFLMAGSFIPNSSLAAVEDVNGVQFPREVDDICRQMMDALYENRIEEVREVMKPLFHENSKAAEYLPQFAERIHQFELQSIQPDSYTYQTVEGGIVHYARYAMHFPEATIYIRFDLLEQSGGYSITNLQVRGAQPSQ